MEKISRISNELKDWIIHTIKSGVNPQQIVEAMIKKGFEQQYSYTIVLQILSKQSIRTIDNQQSPYIYETPAIGHKGNVIHTSDRDIKVLLKIDKPFITYLDNVLSSEECDQLIKLSKHRLEPSQIIDSSTGEKNKYPEERVKGLLIV